MTLLIAAKEANAIWMVADTAITGDSLSVRDREHQPKIFVSQDGHALIGFAGDLFYGSRLSEHAATISSGAAAVAFLLESNIKNSTVDFAYAYTDGENVHLFRIAGSRADEYNDPSRSGRNN